MKAEFKTRPTETPAAMIRRAVRLEADALVMCQDAKNLRIAAQRIRRAKMQKS